MFWIIFIAAAGLSLAGCATVTRGTTDSIQVVSEPSGAGVRTSLNHACVTPCILQVSRKDEFAVTFNKAGYREETIEVKTRIAGAGAAGFAGNIIAGGIVGMGVDAATGSTLEHVPNPISAILRLNGSPRGSGRARPARPPPVVRPWAPQAQAGAAPET